jgi:hypothetical protein
MIRFNSVIETRAQILIISLCMLAFVLVSLSSLGPVDAMAAQIPSTPTNLLAWPMQDRTINLSWNPSIGANGYVIYRNSSLSPNIGFIPLANLPISKTNYTDRDPNLVEGVKYEYRVAAIDSSGGIVSSPSETKSAVPYTPISSANIGVAFVSSLTIVIAISMIIYASVRYSRTAGTRKKKQKEIRERKKEWPSDTNVLQEIHVADFSEQQNKKEEKDDEEANIKSELRLWKFWNIIRDDDWYPSLSLFQFFMWTAVILFSFTFLTFLRLGHELLPSIGGLGSPTILALMGISVATPLVSNVVSSIKYPTSSTFDPPEKLPGLGTMLQEGGKPSLTRFQMFAWTFISIIVFFSSLYVMISDNINSVSELSLPNVDPILLALMGLSQVAYIGGKAISRTPGIATIYPRVIEQPEKLNKDDDRHITGGKLVSIFGIDFGSEEANKTEFRGQVWIGEEEFEYHGPTVTTTSAPNNNKTSSDVTNRKGIIEAWEDDKIDLRIGDLAPGAYYVRVASPGVLYKAKEPIVIKPKSATAVATTIKGSSEAIIPGTSTEA